MVMTKTCNSCGLAKPYADFHKAKRCVGGVAGTCRICRGVLNAAWTAANPEKRRAAAADRRARALAMYSATSDPSCACCGEGTVAFLTFEHTNGGGSQHRAQTGGGGFLSWLLGERREGIEVLCMNCNHGRRVNGGVCPHDELVRQLIGS